MSYETPSLDVSFANGTSALMSGKAREARMAFYDAVADGLEAGEAAILVTTNDSPEQVIAALRDRTTIEADRVGIVDATGDGEDELIDGVTVRTVGSTGDLTGLSLAFAKQLQLLQERGLADRVRVGVDSVSTLMMYAEVQTVFRFLHVFTSRLGSADLLGLFTLTPDMHDEKAVNTVRTLFDTEVQVEGENVSLRGSGYE